MLLRDRALDHASFRLYRGAPPRKLKMIFNFESQSVTPSERSGRGYGPEHQCITEPTKKLADRAEVPMIGTPPVMPCAAWSDPTNRWSDLTSGRSRRSKSDQLPD